MPGGIFAPIVVPIINLLLLIYALVPGQDLGIAIIILTILIRILLWPLLRKQLAQQKKLRDLQPEISKIKKQTKGNKQKESQLMVELFKERGVNPFSSIGLAFLQLPVLFALFIVLREIFNPEVLNQAVYGFVKDYGPVQALISNPSAAERSILGLNLREPSIIMALLAGLGQYAQTKQLTPADTSGTSAKNRFGFNITLIFPVVTAVIATQFAAALSLYWTASSAVAVLQQTILLREDVSIMQRLSRKKPAAKPAKRKKS